MYTTQGTRVQKWALDPLFFVMDAFEMDGRDDAHKITVQQREGLEQYRLLLTAKLKHSRKVEMSDEEKAVVGKIGLTVRSGHGTGKTAFAAWVLLHFMVTRPFCKIPCVAPVGPQLQTNLWPEVRLWLRRSPILSELIQHQAEKIFIKDHKGREWFAFPRTVAVRATEEEQAETLAGIHADYMLIVVDEASGVPEPVFRPLEGGLTGPVNLCLMIGNPTQRTGFFHDSHTKHRSDWMPLHWNAEDSEIVSDLQINRMARKYGRDSNAYRIRVLGEFPTSTPDTLIPYDWILSAVGRDLVVEPDMPLVLGVDVARHGDDESVILKRQGPIIRGPLETFRKLDTKELSYWVHREVVDSEAAACGIDVIGWGAGTYDTCRDVLPCPVFPVNVGEEAENKEQFSRLRDELFWKVRERFQNGNIAIPNDDDLIGELSEIKYNFQRTAKEKVKVESKQEMKERGVASPNRADALIISEYVNRYMVRPRQSAYRPRRRSASAYVG